MGDKKFALNIYVCNDTDSNTLVCKSSCPGVDSDGIIVGKFTFYIYSLISFSVGEDGRKAMP